MQSTKAVTGGSILLFVGEGTIEIAPSREELERMLAAVGIEAVLQKDTTAEVLDVLNEAGTWAYGCDFRQGE